MSSKSKKIFIGLGFAAITAASLVAFQFVEPLLAANDAIGIRVMKNPLHLSPSTWYRSGLCGGGPSFDNFCYSDSDYQDFTDSSLVTYFGFNEGFGSITADASSNQFVGTLSGGAAWNLNGRIDKTIRFDGSGSVTVSHSTTLDIAQDLTLSAWVNLDALNARIIDKVDSYRLSVGGGGHVQIGLFDPVSNSWRVSPATTSQTVPTGGWHHITAVFNREPNVGTQTSEVRIFVDGVNVLRYQGSEFSFGDIGIATSGLVIGGNSSGGANSTIGGIDEVRIYSRALSDEEVLLLATAAGSKSCQLNVPVQGSPQTVLVDGYEAVKEGRSVYVGATNDITIDLFSNIYILSYTQGSSAETVEIFNRILDPTKQAGDWYFNDGVTNSRICSGIGVYEGTTDTCAEPLGTAVGGCNLHASDTDCATASGCQAVANFNICIARSCDPIYCASDLDCPVDSATSSNYECLADKNELTRDARRYGNLRDIQILLERVGYPTLGGGTYIAANTVSVWPSWQQTFGAALGGGLPVDPLNQFIGCPSGDPDQITTCWNETSKEFFCPTGGFVYAYRSTDSGQSYELFTNFERLTTPAWASGSYQFPTAQVNPTTCKLLNFEIHQATVGGSAFIPLCDASHDTDGDGDNDDDGICDNAPDNCINDYNPDQADSGGFAGLGDVCDVTCSADSDGDGWCDQYDDCRTVANCSNVGPNGQTCLDDTDSDDDGVGDACDPCTDLDGDGWWDIDTPANDPLVCGRDNCYVGAGGSVSQDHFFYCAVFSDSSLSDASFLRMTTVSCCNQFNTQPQNCANTVAPLLPSGQYTGCVNPASPGGLPISVSFNPLQEDFDNDLSGYICDFCIDFDADGFGDWPFYTGSNDLASLSSLTDSEIEHFKSCAAPTDLFSCWDSTTCNLTLGGSPVAFYMDNDEDGDAVSTQTTCIWGSTCPAQSKMKFAAGNDCQDNNPNNSSTGTETCDSQDNNCNSQVDEGGVCAAPTFDLTVSKAGTGAGTVTSNPTGINCGSDCDETYTSGTSVTLTAGAAAGSTFAGWSGGGCLGTGTCQVTVTAATIVTATFNTLPPSTYALTVSKAGTGAGTVTSNPTGINCGSDCDETYTSGTSVTLTAGAAAGSTFAGWSGGGCLGTGTCQVTVTAATTVTATFNTLPPSTYALTVSKAGTGAGTVTSNPTGINCGSDCDETYTSGTSVTLTAAAAAGSTFAGWSGGGCSGTGTCQVTVTAATTVTATFNTVPENC